ncbi:tRNA wybutosine-synthesizing protein 1-like protein [Hibiscus syriacus]|uniref:tRNA wybutosine-synthesizing protein 1-like protein n=1 Tax=Hibiscus syriacus TaxID=106335 RepID=A0A6A2ZGP2_HIBSY|nr:tRNA wybutosine-synthesizing protein 1-like protein [Hibiscus syriacus]
MAPLIVNVEPNLNVVLTACLAVYVGCYRSVKPTPPACNAVIIFLTVQVRIKGLG